VSSLYKKISHPVLTGLKLVVDPDIKLAEVYPPHLPDLFHGTQLVVLGRYNGEGEAKVRLSGNVGKEQRDYVYSMNFAKKTGDDKNFVEDLWARRKVGYMLDQIRISGESKELVDEIVALAKRYGITTPYTSYLIVPDEPVPVARRELLRQAEGAAPAADRPDVRFHLNLGAQAGSGGFGGGIGAPAGIPGPAPTDLKTTATAPSYTPPVLQQTKGEGKEEKQTTVTEFIKKAQTEPGKAADTRGDLADRTLKELDKLNELAKNGDAKGVEKGAKDGASYFNRPVEEARQRLDVYQKAQEALRAGKRDDVQNGYLGVNLSMDCNQLRNQVRLSPSAVRCIQNRSTLNVGGVWIDETYHAKLKTVTVKALSPAYFRILEKHPEMRDVFRLGNYLVWVTPSDTALVVDTTTGAEEMSDEAIEALFSRKN
jgi:Ca-activated chloride channel family protein